MVINKSSNHVTNGNNADNITRCVLHGNVTNTTFGHCLHKGRDAVGGVGKVEVLVGGHDTRNGGLHWYGHGGASKKVTLGHDTDTLVVVVDEEGAHPLLHLESWKSEGVFLLLVV